MVAGRLCKGRRGKTTNQLLEEDVLNVILISALCCSSFSSCDAFSKQWSQT